ncbi:MAG: CapA family protein [Deltaproteobacteria bacterium]|nr:CapA family protein [Deltaproteobacteria bacterium]
MADKVTIYAVGDVSPARDRGEFLLAHTAPILNQADITFCQLENPFSRRALPRTGTAGYSLDKDVEASRWADQLPCSPADAAALVKAGFKVCSFAGNRCFRMGKEGFLDTLDILRQNNIQVIGTGRNIAEARQPAVLERNGTKVAFLAYNSVVAPESEARVDKAGCVPMRASTSYEQVDWQPGTPPRIITSADKDDLSAMLDDIRKARGQADVVVVSIHWGVHLVPAVIAMYQYEVGHAAIDAGADLILGHHPHILKGIEVYKGRVIFYSMGNFAFESWIGHPSPEGKTLYRVKPDPEYPTYLFSPDCRKSILVKVVIANKKIELLSFQPAMINKQGQSELLPRSDKRSNEVYEYMEWVCRDQELNTTFSRQGDEVVVVAS